MKAWIPVKIKVQCPLPLCISYVPSDYSIKVVSIKCFDLTDKRNDIQILKINTRKNFSFVYDQENFKDYVEVIVHKNIVSSFWIHQGSSGIRQWMINRFNDPII